MGIKRLYQICMIQNHFLKASLFKISNRQHLGQRQRTAEGYIRLLKGLSVFLSLSFKMDILDSQRYFLTFNGTMM